VELDVGPQAKLWFSALLGAPQAGPSRFRCQRGPAALDGPWIRRSRVLASSVSVYLAAALALAACRRPSDAPLARAALLSRR